MFANPFPKVHGVETQTTEELRNCMSTKNRLESSKQKQITVQNYARTRQEMFKSIPTLYLASTQRQR